jgi:hypothetical protein
MKITKLDQRAVAAIRECGFVSMEADGKPRLESSKNVTAFRLKRLVQLGLVVSGGDALFNEAAPPQTYVLATS